MILANLDALDGVYGKQPGKVGALRDGTFGQAHDLGSDALHNGMPSWNTPHPVLKAGGVTVYTLRLMKDRGDSNGINESL